MKKKRSDPIDPILADLARQIRAWRREFCWTQTDLAVKAGTSQTQIVRMESGDKPSTLNLLIRVAEAFGADASIRLIAKTASPHHSQLIERVAAAIYNARPAHSVHARWQDLIDFVNAGPSDLITEIQIRHYQELINHRRDQARAVLHELGYRFHD